MSKSDEPREHASSKEEAGLRVFRRILSARERDHIDELAAALMRYLDPTGPASASDQRQKEK